MISVDEDALICDLAETYHIYNYRELPAKLVATLSNGLRADSRIVMKLNESKVSTETMLGAAILDHLKILVWQKTEDGAKNRNRPKLLLDEFNVKQHNLISFYSGKDFEKTREKLIGGDNS